MSSMKHSSVALPDRYEKSGPPPVVTNNFMISISFIIGACGVAVMGMSLTLKTTEFFNFGNFILDILDQTPFVEFTGYGSLLLGLYGIVVGAVLGISGLLSLKAPYLVYLAYLLLLIDAGAHIAAGVVINQGVQSLDDAIYKRSTTPAAAGSFNSRVIHMQLAMFNGCCAPQGWSKEVYENEQYPDARDITPQVDACSSLHPENIRSMKTVTTDLRTCYDSAVDYSNMNYTVGRNLPRICDTLEQARVNIEGKKIPGMNMDVISMTRGVKLIPIVGQVDQPTYGCGIGYALAFQAAMLVWAANTLTPIATAFLACGIIEGLLLMTLLLTQYSCSRKSETSEEAYARYMEELANPQHQQFEHQNPNRMSMQPGQQYVYPAQIVDGSSRDGNSSAGSRRGSVQDSQHGGSRRMSIQSQQMEDFNRQQQRPMSMQRPMSVQRPMSMQGQPMPPQYYQQQQQQPSMVAFNVDDKI